VWRCIAVVNTTLGTEGWIPPATRRRALPDGESRFFVEDGAMGIARRSFSPRTARLESKASTDESRAGHFARGLRFLLDDPPIGIDGRALAFEKPTLRIEERPFGFASAPFGATVRLRRRKHALFERNRRNRNRPRDVLRQNGAPGFDSHTSSSIAAVFPR
jgi:hypothetical protein